MSFFKRDKKQNSLAGGRNVLAEMVLKVIHEGVLIVDEAGVVTFVNPAAVIMIECGSESDALSLKYDSLVKIESFNGETLDANSDSLARAIQAGQPLENFECNLVTLQTNKKIPVAISVLFSQDDASKRVITIRNITKEKAEESEQAEFISTASHEMRTPVASIEGYLSLALNPQTAAIDERARGYLDAAHSASKHLGKLFQDLLDVTKLDDGRIRPHLAPINVLGAVKQFADASAIRASGAGLKYYFGDQSENTLNQHRLEQALYSILDPDFLREVIDNIMDNAIKYTPAGGSIYVNVVGEEDKNIISIKDTGMGISAEDLGHIFQKFYRADNSDTRTIGGTGLGLYLVKQRVEAMGGHVWAESVIGHGSTFYISFPRISIEEYEKRMIAIRNQQQLNNNQNGGII